MTGEVLAVIPARGGSKAIPRKNLAGLCGRPLLAYTVEAALECPAVSRTIVSTDDPEIAQLAIRLGAEVPFMRPSALAADEVHSIVAVLHALSWLEREESYTPDIVVMLLPTAPLRSAEHIDAAIGILEEAGAPSVVSVFKSDKALPHLRRVRDGVLEPLVKLETPNVQRQDLEDLYVLNGAVYVASPATLSRHGSFHVPGAVPYVMRASDSVDIDEVEDLHYAEYLLCKGEA